MAKEHFKIASLLGQPYAQGRYAAICFKEQNFKEVLKYGSVSSSEVLAVMRFVFQFPEKYQHLQYYVGKAMESSSQLHTYESIELIVKRYQDSVRIR
jgi:hypothetical protein